MADTQSESIGADAEGAPQSPIALLNLLGGEAAGLCSGGVCRLPIPSVEKAE